MTGFFRARTLAAGLCALLAWSIAALAEAPSPVKGTEVTDPRPFGYVIGDTFTRRIVIETDRTATIDEERLPKPGRVSNWIELVRADHRASSAGANERHEIALVYQVFNSAPEVKTVVLPALPVPFKTAGGTVTHEVPGFYFTVAPLTPEYVMGREGLEELRQDAPPLPLSTTAVRARIALYGAGLAAIALYFVYAYIGLPFLARSRGPFARALRAVNTAARKRAEPQATLLALRAVHRAFDETAGGTVFGDHLDGFFLAYPRFAPLRSAVEQFFNGSRKTFFGEGSTEISLAWLATLCRELRDRERGVA